MMECGLCQIWLELAWKAHICGIIDLHLQVAIDVGIEGWLLVDAKLQLPCVKYIISSALVFWMFHFDNSEGKQRKAVEQGQEDLQ